MKNFTEADVKPHGSVKGAGHICAEHEQLIHAPLWYHNKGLQQTASGYGAKLTSSNKIMFEGKPYRLYATCYSNAASIWFTVKGRKIFVS